LARPLKLGLDYFPMDVVLDDATDLLEAECGLEGFAILIKLWQKIYSNGYYLNWGDDAELLFSRKINSEKTKVNSVINASFRRKLLDQNMYNLHGILTSKGIQKRYITACATSKRTSIPMIKQYVLVNDDFKKFITTYESINSEETEVNSEETEVNSGNLPEETPVN
jgi:hypothetical protein